MPGATRLGADVRDGGSVSMLTGLALTGSVEVSHAARMRAGSDDQGPTPLRVRVTTPTSVGQPPVLHASEAPIQPVDLRRVAVMRATAYIGKTAAVASSTTESYDADQSRASAAA